MRQVLDSGASAVEVTTIFDGATLEQEVLWRGGVVEARDPTGAATVRLGDGGFELVRPDGERVAIGPRTRVTLPLGAVTFVVAGTTAPRKLPVGKRGGWRRRLGLLAVAVAGVSSGVLLQTAKTRRPTWELPEIVRRRIALLGDAALRGGTEAMKVSAELRPSSRPAPAPPPRPAQAPTTSQRRTRAATMSAAARSATAETTPAKMEKMEKMESAATGEQMAALQAQRLDDARRAAVARARAAGVVGELAHLRAPLLGSEHVVAAEFTDAGSIAIARAQGAVDGAAASAGGSSDGAGSRDGNSGAGSRDGNSGAGSSDGNSGAGSRDGDSGAGSRGAGRDSGTLDGSEVGEAYGVGGLGLRGIGEGGGGVGDGTIGLGNLGTIGYGGGSGTGYGYGSGAGGLGGRHGGGIICALKAADVRGSCDKDLIRRVVRAHVNELRFCYERALQTRPSLAGRAVSRFVIGFDGRVSSSTIASSTVGAEVDACVAQAIARWQFVPRCVGVVSYPFVFEAIRDAP